MILRSPHAPEPVQWNGPDTRDDLGPNPADDRADEERAERDWFALEVEARQFIESYGAAAMLRCVSRALETRK